MCRRTLKLLTILLCAAPGAALAQMRPTGHVAVLADFFPNRDDTAELRTRLFAEQKLEPSTLLRVTLSGFVEALLARRPTSTSGARGDTLSDTHAAIARVQDANLEFKINRVDLLAGLARVPWGKLDELQPTDVVNPLDVSRFFFEGRSEARLPVAVLRARLFFTDDIVLEGVYLPAFRRGRFDQLDEPTSPFNPVLAAGSLLPGPGPTFVDRKPDFGESQGGARFSATLGRVDWSVCAFRGFESFGLLSASMPAVVERRYPRFTVVGGDFETVKGEWGLRGEVAAFIDDNFQSSTLAIVDGSSLDAGVGLDRRAGDYRLSGTILFHREQYDVPLGTPDGERRRDDLSLIASADRSFARERYQVRIFAVYNTSEVSGFARGISTATLRDNLVLEASVGWFVGRGRDVVGRFADSDFVYARVKYYF